jgi:hypothetical protein
LSLKNLSLSLSLSVRTHVQFQLAMSLPYALSSLSLSRSLSLRFGGPFALGFFICSALSVVPTPLIEPRYLFLSLSFTYA